MTTPRSATDRATRPARLVRRPLAWVLLLGAALALAAGCGSDEGASESTSSVSASDGPLAWLPANTWVVGQVTVDPKQLDQGLETLGRLPIWDLASAQLPAKDGAGLRRALLQELGSELPGKQSPQQLEDAFGTEAGFAVTSNDLAHFGDLSSEDGTLPIAVWIEVDDEDAADDVLDAVFPKAETHERKGVEYATAELGGDQYAWTTSGDLLMLTNGAKELDALIDVRDGDGSLAEDDDARRALAGALDGSALTVAVGTDAVLAALPEAVESEAATDSSDGALGNSSGLPSRETVSDIVRSASVDALIPDWIGFSTVIDDTGIRGRTTWSNPREIAKADVGSRELVERMPATTEFAAGQVRDGAVVGRVQAVWKDVAKAADLDIDDLTKSCPPKGAAKICAALVSTLTWVLEDEDLAQQAAEAEPTTTVVVEPISAIFGSAFQQSLAALQAGGDPSTLVPGAAGAGLVPGFEVAVAGGDAGLLDSLGFPAVDAPADVQAAVRAAGLVVTPSADGLSVNVRVTAGSEIAAAIARTPATAAGPGFSARQLLAPRGITIAAKRVDDVTVTTLPMGATSAITPALEGDVDVLEEDDDYTRAVKQVRPPEQLGTYGWLDLGEVVDAALAAIAKESPAVKRIQPTVSNNLDPIPGILGWTTRTEVDGEQLGVAEYAVPIID